MNKVSTAGYRDQVPSETIDWLRRFIPAKGVSGVMGYALLLGLGFYITASLRDETKLNGRAALGLGLATYCYSSLISDTLGKLLAEGSRLELAWNYGDAD